MTDNQHPNTFLTWYQQLQELAGQGGLQALVSGPDGHLAAYQKGLSPDEELAELEELSEWKGCACGG